MSDVNDRYITATNAAKVLGVDRKTISNRMKSALDAGRVSEPRKLRNAAVFQVADVRSEFHDRDPGEWPLELTADLEQEAARPSATVWLAVPSEDGDRVRELGAKWSKRDHRWFAPRDAQAALAAWVDPGPLPTDLTGEDRAFGGGLRFDPIPRSARANVRSRVSPRDWWRISYMVRSRASFTCELCDNSDRTMHAHERFEFNEGSRIQILRRLVCVCELCHAGTHIGNTGARTGTTNDVEQHMMRVMNVDAADLADLRRAADNRNFELGSHEWTLDLSILDGLGLDIDTTPVPATTAPPTPPPAPLPAAEPDAIAQPADQLPGFEPFDDGIDHETDPWSEPTQVLDAPAPSPTPRRSTTTLTAPITAARLRRELHHIERGWLRRLLRR